MARVLCLELNHSDLRYTIPEKPTIPPLNNYVNSQTILMN